MIKVDQKIELQTTARLFHINNTTIINRSGKAIEIPDESHFIYDVLSQLDGKCTVTEVYGKLSDIHQSNHPIDHIVDILNQLDEFCIFENRDLTNPSRQKLSDYQHNRWNRNFDFFGAFCSSNGDKYEAQNAIANAKVVLFGVGGVGTHTLLDLVSFGFTNITAVDFDKIELSSLNRQILYSETDVGRNKVEAAQESINRYINPENHNIRFLDTYIDSADSAQQIVAGADIVIGCVDRPTNVVGWISEACVRENIPLVTGGVDTTRTTTYTVIPGETGCIECWRKGYADASENNSQLLEKELERDVLVLPPRPAVVNLVSVQVGFLMSEVIKIVTGICKPSATNKLIEFDFATMATNVAEEWKKLPDCPVCGASSPKVAAE